MFPGKSTVGLQVCLFGWVRFLETQPSGRRYIYLGRYVFEKLPRRGGGTLIWGGSFIWQWIVAGTVV